MLTGLVLASVLGVFALPEFTRLADAIGLTDDDEGTRSDGSEVDGTRDLLVTMDGDGDADTGSQATDTGTDLDITAWDAVPGGMKIENFDPEAQELALRVPENTTGYLTRDGDPDAKPPVAPMLTFEVPDGAVELYFTGMSSVPVDAISLSVAGADAVGIQSVLLNDDPGLVADDPEEGAIGSDPSEGDGDPVLPDDPEEVATPDDTDGLDAQDPILPDADADPFDAAGVGDPQRIIGFDPETDVLEIEGDRDATVSIRSSFDGADSHVLLDDALVAVVVAVPDLAADAVQLVPRAV